MAKKNKNEIAVVGQVDLGQVPMYLEQVVQQIDALEAKFGSGTDGDMPSSTTLDVFGDLSTCEDITELVKANSAIVGRAAAYTASAKTLGVSLTNYPFRINKATAEKWTKYIKRRVGEVTFKDELASLKAIKADLIDLSSEDDKKKAKLASLSSKLERYAGK